ncbi:PREDICTED: uncharacterized protein LOC105954486 [Erythranthe guttata]|uniref:uncharacterized protein LOC105954486 n=1 Tax=Erythranthe guttata TaxID=4155 RepID=UPI00064DE1DE|nr:PREDICTED: uncharacterized protein LOC105954486 [Erythranthe guttata]|eukprot:XP_012833612.1 PREDICTED: uncharacterized protein LOC105954486 [Erythranthe guttata]
MAGPAPLFLYLDCPTNGSIKINFDAALPPGKPFYACATVARNQDRQCLGWAIRHFPGKPTPTDCEAHAALVSMVWARRQEWDNIILEGDNLTVINFLKNKENTSASFGAFIEECISISSSFSSCIFSFINRKGNALAHSFATNLSYSCNEGIYIPSDLGHSA